MFAWPKLELTDYERRYVRYYKTKKFPGVLKRSYRIGTFCPVALPEIGQIAPLFRANLQVSRRARVFGLTFIGDLGSWFLKIQPAAGELFTAANTKELTNGTVPPPGCLVSSMIAGTVSDAESWAGLPVPSPTVGLGGNRQAGLKVIEPNWLLQPNTTLQFEATVAPNIQRIIDGEIVSETSSFFIRPTLAIGAHIWEFPGMSRGADDDAPGEEEGAPA